MTIEQLVARKGTEVYSIQPNACISDAAKLMNENHIGALMVLNENQNIEGIVSERDILRQFVLAKEDIHNMLVKDLMTPKKKLIVSNKDNDLRYVMSIMTENNIRHIPIVEGETLVALISIRDIIKFLLENAEYEKELLTEYLSGTDLD